MLISRASNPRALKGYPKEHLSVIYKANKKAWITSAIFNQWLAMYAIPAMKEYCAKENLKFKILLVIDNAPAHPPNIDDLHDNVKVIFLPPNTTALTKPMDQGVIAAFKAYYLWCIMDQLLKTTDKENKPTIQKYWQGFNILYAIDNIGKAWEEVSESYLNEELTNEDLQQLTEYSPVEDDGDEEITQRTLTTKRMAEAFNMIQQGLQIFSDDDPNREHSSEIQRNIDDSLACYNEIYKEKKRNIKQTKLDRI
ncbi:tigger transposable element-derived protein 1-like [Homarus americanus]|uniref:tigger transposable element-derived protein 1-like n=1 Tax=Homarus americanus TaxID=6706 RepID=UPI001C4771E8|nr:tigger transposable element-derived protein 1-like [Homarus americanus]